MDVDEFWLFLEHSARESHSRQERTGWEDKLSHISRAHIEDFQVHLDAARRRHLSEIFHSPSCH